MFQFLFLACIIACVADDSYNTDNGSYSSFLALEVLSNFYATAGRNAAVAASANKFGVYNGPYEYHSPGYNFYNLRYSKFGSRYNYRMNPYNSNNPPYYTNNYLNFLPKTTLQMSDAEEDVHASGFRGFAAATSAAAGGFNYEFRVSVPGYGVDNGLNRLLVLSRS